MIGLKCPVCGSDNVRENSNLVKAESGDWGICRDCLSVVRIDMVDAEKEENP